VRNVHPYVDAQYEATFQVPFFEGTHWALPGDKKVTEGMSSAFADPNSYPIDKRAASYSIGYFSPKHLGSGQFYLMAIKDKSGRPLAGGKTYRLTVPPNPPLKLYWSATAYDRQTHALIRDTSRSSRGSNSAEIQKNPDGSADVYFSPTAPPGKEANWIPTGHDFEVLFRLYGPEQPLFDKTWVLPDVGEVK